MSGRDQIHKADSVYRLRDVETDRIVGRLRADGEVESDDASVRERIRHAWQREVMVDDNGLVTELEGVCFAEVRTVKPGDVDHDAVVLRYLAALSGLMPERE